MILTCNDQFDTGRPGVCMTLNLWSELKVTSPKVRTLVSCPLSHDTVYCPKFFTMQGKRAESSTLVVTFSWLASSIPTRL